MAQKPFSSSLLTLKININENLGPRFGIVVSKAVNKSAVRRNKLKRVIRKEVEENLGEENKDFLFIVKKDPENIENLAEQTRKIYEEARDFIN